MEKTRDFATKMREFLRKAPRFPHLLARRKIAWEAVSPSGGAFHPRRGLDADEGGERGKLSTAKNPLSRARVRCKGDFIRNELPDGQRRLGLMLRAEEIVDRLHGIERAERHFNEDSVPVAHGAIPEAGEFECQQFFAVLGFVGNETGGGIDEIGQMEFFAVEVAQTTHEIDGIEVRALFEERFFARIVHVDLAALEDLERNTPSGL